MPRAVIFAGPSLAAADAAGRIDAELLPPIQRGDIDALLARPERPAAIAIIDGVFLQVPSISPKEVLRAVDAGIAVFGSSSMGALRAAECARYGVIGVGRIFEEYRSGRIDADDEVAMVYDPVDFSAMSEPLINMRFAIEAALAAGAVTPAIADRFLTIAKKLYFPRRTTKAVLQALSAELAGPDLARLQQFLSTSAPDTKREDALQLLAAMQAHLVRA